MYPLVYYSDDNNNFNPLKEFYNIKHYTLDSIPDHCAVVFKIMNTLKLISFTYGFANLPIKIDAITEYKAEHNLYLTLISRNKVNYPFQSSRDRRLNFTLAHEIGHIILDHLPIAPQLKTKEENSQSKQPFSYFIFYYIFTN